MREDHTRRDPSIFKSQRHYLKVSKEGKRGWHEYEIVPIVGTKHESEAKLSDAIRLFYMQYWKVFVVYRQPVF